jgi:hypothetical protein
MKSLNAVANLIGRRHVNVSDPSDGSKLSDTLHGYTLDVSDIRKKAFEVSGVYILRNIADK